MQCISFPKFWNYQNEKPQYVCYIETIVKEVLPFNHKKLWTFVVLFRSNLQIWPYGGKILLRPVKYALKWYMPSISWLYLIFCSYFHFCHVAWSCPCFLSISWSDHGLVVKFFQPGMFVIAYTFFLENEIRYDIPFNSKTTSSSLWVSYLLLPKKRHPLVLTVLLRDVQQNFHIYYLSTDVIFCGLPDGNAGKHSLRNHSPAVAAGKFNSADWFLMLKLRLR